MSAIRGASEAFESAVAPHYAGLVRRLTAVVRVASWLSRAKARLREALRHD